MTSRAEVTSVFILGGGKVGRALARALRDLKRPALTVTLRPARAGLPRQKIDSDVLVLAVRDRDLTTLASTLAARGLVSKRTACVHVAGSQTAEALAPLRASSAGVAQMHPLISFASRRKFPSLARGNALVQGDPVAAKRARSLMKRLGMTPRTFPSIDPIGYHAAAGLVANGAAALAAVGAELLVKSGVPIADAPRMLGPLLRSVAENVEALGFPDALTGPVRRGDVDAVRKHWAILRERLPAAFALYLASVEAQIPLARALGEAPSGSFDAIVALVAEARGEILRVKNSARENPVRDAKE